MFERFAREARRVIFYALDEAKKLGCRFIEPEHLLLGLLREDILASKRVEHGGATIESIRKKIEQYTPATSGIALPDDIRLSEASKRALTYGMEETDHGSHEWFGTERL
jgi:ATP-dependent Clp protease ATP-binding subunit ClpC